MTKSRANLFGEPADIDLSSFAPKQAVDTKAPPAEAVRAVAETAQFRSRERPAAPAAALSAKRAPRRHRTGRNVQFNAKVTQETADAIYAVTDAHTEEGWVIGYTLERAIAALQRELEQTS